MFYSLYHHKAQVPAAFCQFQILDLVLKAPYGDRKSVESKIIYFQYILEGFLQKLQFVHMKQISSKQDCEALLYVNLKSVKS